MRRKHAIHVFITAALLASAACTDQSVSGPDSRPIASASVAPDSLVLTVGTSHALRFTLRAADGSEITGRSVTWTSWNEGVATVSSTGVVTAVSEGTVQISANHGGHSGHATIQVQRPPVASLTIIGDSIRVLERGESAQFIAIPRAADGSDLNGVIPTWTTSDPQVAWVSDTGGVVAQRGGSTVITATAGGRSTSVRVRVPMIDYIEVLPRGASMAIGSTLQARAVVHTEAGPRLIPVSWASENEDIAVIGAGGSIASLRAGIAVIRSSAEGVEGRVMIHVEGVRRPFPAIRANGQSLPLSVRDTEWQDESGTVHAAELVLLGGRLAFLDGSRYHLRLYVGYRVGGEMMATEVQEDEGRLQFQLLTGNPVLASETVPGRESPGIWDMANGLPTGSVSFHLRVGGEGPPVTIFFRQ